MHHRQCCERRNRVSTRLASMLSVPLLLPRNARRHRQMIALSVYMHMSYTPHALLSSFADIDPHYLLKFAVCVYLSPTSGTARIFLEPSALSPSREVVKLGLLSR